MDYKELYRKAAEVMPNAYAPFSKFNVGAALLTKTGKSLPVSTWKILLTALRSVPSGQLASKPSRRVFVRLRLWLLHLAEERHTPAASADNFSTNLHRILTLSSGKTRRT